MTIKKATHQETRKHNRDLILKTVFEAETISRAEISRITNLTRPTVSDLVNDLVTEGLVEEVGIGSSIGGKSPILLSLVKDSRYMIGLNLAYDQFYGEVVNLRGEVKAAETIPVSGRDGEQALGLAYKILDRLTGLDLKPLVGIGVGTPGLVNTREGVVVNAVNLDWRNLPLARLLQDRYHLPTHIMNDSQAAAVGEFVYGGGYPSDDSLVVINVGQGIGAGVLINGHLFQGDGGSAGEIGHIVAQENGSRCRCGKHGCLETLASTRAVLGRAQELASDFPASRLLRNREGITLDSMVGAFSSNDPLAEQVVMDAAHYLGLSIAGLVSTFDIQRFVLVGDMTRFGQRWLDAVREAAVRTTLSELARDVHIDMGKLDYHRSILGASALTLLDGYSLLFMNSSND